MKKYISLMLLLVFAMACEDDLVITVPASSSISFTMPSATINAQPNNSFSSSQEVDVTQFFDENSDQIEGIKLDKLTYEVADYTNTSGNVVLMDFTIATSLDGVSTDILTVSGLVVENTGEVVAFEDGNPVSALSAAQVASLESIMENLEPFEISVTANFTDSIDGDFAVNMAWDITASIAQETGG